MADSANATLSSATGETQILSSQIQENWAALRTVLYQIMSGRVSGDNNIELPGYYISPTIPRGQDSVTVQLNEVQISNLLAEIALGIETAAEKLEKNNLEPYRFELKQLQKPATHRGTIAAKQAEKLLAMMNGIQTAPEQENESYYKKLKELQDKADKKADDKASETEKPTEVPKDNLTEQANLPSQEVIAKQTQARAETLEDELATAINHKDLSSIRKLVEEAGKANLSYRKVSNDLVQRLIDPLVTQQLQELELGVSFQEFAAANPAAAEKFRYELTYGAESWVRDQFQNDPSIFMKLASAEGRVKAMSDLSHSTLPALISWKSNVQYTLQVLSVNRPDLIKPNQPKVDLIQDGPQSSEPLLDLDTASKATQQAENDKKIAPAYSQALIGLTPEQQKNVELAATVALTYGIPPQRFAELASTHWVTMIGSQPPKDLLANEVQDLLTEITWKMQLDGAQPLMINDMPAGPGFYTPEQQLIWYLQAQTKLTKLSSTELTPQQVRDSLVQASQQTATRTGLPAAPPPPSFATTASPQTIKVVTDIVSEVGEGKLPDGLDPDQIAAKIEEEAHLRFKTMMDQTVMAINEENRQLREQMENGQDGSVNEEYQTAQVDQTQQIDFGSDSQGFAQAGGGGTVVRFLPTKGEVNDLAQNIRNPSPTPPNQNLANAAPSTRKNIFTHLVSGVRNRFSPRKKATDTLLKKPVGLAGKAAVNAGLNAVPGVGQALSAGFTVLSDKNARKAALAGAAGGLALGGTLLGPALNALSSSGPGALSAAGNLAGRALGSGIPGIGNTSLGATGLGGSGGGTIGASGPGTLGITKAVNALKAMVTSPAGIGVAGLIGVGGLGSIMATTVILHSFLALMPNSLGEDVSKYVTITKTALPESPPDQKYDKPQDLSYKITICAKRGYKVTIASITDTFTVNVNDDERAKEGIAKGVVPATPTSPITLASVKKLTLDSSSPDVPNDDCTDLDPYPIHFDDSYVHSSVGNVVKISFGAVDAAGAPQAENGSQVLTASGSENICFGKCPTALAKCWPVTGYITQTTYDPGSPGTHKDVEALDIGGNNGNPIFTPFDGTASFFTPSSGIDSNYGNHVLVVSKDGSFALIYAHMSRLGGSGTNVPVSEGQVLGYVGATGNVTGPHLHVELWLPSTSKSAFDGFYIPPIARSHPSRLELMMPKETPNHADPRGTPVKTCW